MARRLALTLVVMLAFPASAFAAANVDINASAPIYSPQKVTISPGDSVIWTHNNDPVLSPHGVRFDDEASGSETCSATLFVTGSTCTRAFPNPGRYGYFDPATCTDPPASACSVNGLVVVYVPPTASFSAGPNPQVRGQAVNFDGSASTSPGGSLTNYAWDFGDGTGATGPTTSHAYATAGTYDVKLSVTDDQGNLAVSTQQVTVNIPDTDADGVNDDVDKCVTDAGPAPDGCPLAPPSPIPGALATSATAAGALGVNGALKSGVTVVLNCSAACTGVFTLTRNGTSVTLPQTASLDGPGSKLVTLRFTSAAKRSLAKVKNPKLIMSVVVTDALGRKQTDKKAVVLRQIKTYGRLPAIGISDNNQGTFDDPNFQVLKLRYARLVSPWNAIFTEPDRLDSWLQSARAHKIRPLVSFEHTRGQACPGTRCKGPSKAQYTKAWKAFHMKYPWVKDVSPWNEVNSATQPTGKHPEQAAAYYNVVRANCRGCTIVAADLLDASNIRRYSAAFLAKAKGKPRLWGLHNYTDTNRFRSRGTKALLQTVKGTVWLTETGGVVKFVTQKGVVALPKSESRAKKAMDYMFRLAEQNAARIKRIYVYQWKVNNVFDRFDAGVVRPDGTPRPSFSVLSINASIARKR